MKITRAGDYALRVLAYIASKNDRDSVYMRNELSELCGVPDSFLGKILQSLARDEILTSERGKKGGFRLVKDPSEISIYDVIKSVEGDIKLNDCLVDKDFCESSSTCNINTVLEDIRQNLINDLKKYSLRDIVA